MSLNKAKKSAARAVTEKKDADIDALPSSDVGPKAFERATGSRSKLAQVTLLNDLLKVIQLPSDPEEQEQKILPLLTLLESIKPKGEVEGMLAIQMVATHTAAMDWLGRATNPKQTFAGQDMSLRHAEKLLALFARQLEVLDKRRGKGKQQVTVKYVNVESGGQAVVGNVRSDVRPAKIRGRAAAPLVPPEGSGARIELDIVPAKRKPPSRRKI